MLLLLTIALVIIGFVLLGVGFVQSSTTPIFFSIGFSVVAMFVLYAFHRMSGKASATSTNAVPVPLVATEPSAPDLPTFAAAETGPATQTLPVATVAPAETAFADGEDDDYFPIEDYDDLKVAEILPLLPELELDELDMVREREESTKNRAGVLAKVDQQIEKLEAEEDAAAVPAVAAAAPRAAPDPEPALAAVAPAADSPVGDEDDYFPIEEYDDLRAAEILPLLPELEDDELEMVEERELAGANRANILRRISILLGDEQPEGDDVDVDDLDEVPAPPPLKKAAAKKAPPAKKAASVAVAATPAKKAAAPAKKAAAPAKKVAVPAKNVAPPVKAATAKKAAPPAPKAAPLAAPAKKAAAPAKRAAPMAPPAVPAKKVLAKKAVAAKTAAKR